MSNTLEEKTNSEHLTKEEYNSIPVYYCKHCGSLAIMTAPELPEDYCDKCGSTTIGKASIEAWLELQKTIYNPMKEEERRRLRRNIFKY